ncbi:hypothetical protein [Xanthomarina gelatinilytica]|uniref:hypothetical protein n=1 Tax=Xanthomarina gelatinilytica TaxID=1137281 RepID=UPI003AA8AFF9
MSGKLLNRESLKGFFKNGSQPNEDNFSSMIDSMLNKVDDRIAKNVTDGLILCPDGIESNRVISFYKEITDDGPVWSFELLKDTGDISISEVTEGKPGQTRLIIKKGGNVGINTSAPRTNLEVDGVLGSTSKIGTHKIATVPADGNWHDIITDLNGYSAFEIVAQVGKAKSGKHSLLHAHAISTFGRSRSKIKCTQAYYGWWWNKIALRWRGSTFDYKLQMKTRSDYGSDQKIRFHIGKLWDDDIMTIFDKM